PGVRPAQVVGAGREVDPRASLLLLQERVELLVAGDRGPELLGVLVERAEVEPRLGALGLLLGPPAEHVLARLAGLVVLFPPVADLRRGAGHDALVRLAAGDRDGRDEREATRESEHP